MHPIGSFYTSEDPTNPSTLFGGTWEQIKDRFIYASGSKTAGTVGGEEKHKLLEAEMPAHAHTRGTMEIRGSSRPLIRSGGHPLIIDTTWGALFNEYPDSLGYEVEKPVANTNTKYKGTWLSFQASRNWTGETSYEGGDQAHNNMPPYIVAYIWKRIA